MTTPTFSPGDRVRLKSNLRYVFMGIEEDPASRFSGEVVSEVIYGAVKIKLDGAYGTVVASAANVELLP